MDFPPNYIFGIYALKHGGKRKGTPAQKRRKGLDA
jgi:hypothetical protein